MFEYIRNIKPLLEELDAVVDFSHPVKIDVLIDLTKKHSTFKEISLAPINKRSILGFHVASPEKSNVVIFYRPCPVHSWQSPSSACTSCRLTRFIIAKELSHAFDCDDELTAKEEVEELLIKDLIKGTFGSKKAQSDVLGSAWALELLVRYEHRKTILGGGALPEDPKLTSARDNEDFSYFAQQFCVPVWLAEVSFHPPRMKAMAALRAHVGLSV